MEVRSEYINCSLSEVRDYAQMVGGDINLADHFFWHYEALEWVKPGGAKIANWKAQFNFYRVKAHEYSARDNRLFNAKIEAVKQDYFRRNAEKNLEQKQRKNEGTATTQFAVHEMYGYLWFGYDWYIHNVNIHGKKFNDSVIMQRDPKTNKPYWRVK